MSNPFRGMHSHYLLQRAREADVAAERALSVEVMDAHRRLAALAREAACQEFGYAGLKAAAIRSPVL